MAISQQGSMARQCAAPRLEGKVTIISGVSRGIAADLCEHRLSITVNHYKSLLSGNGNIKDSHHAKGV